MRVLLVNNSEASEVRKARMTSVLLDALERLGMRVTVVATAEEVAGAVASVDAVVLSGGPLRLSARSSDLERYAANTRALWEARGRRLPLLGICFGMQVCAAALGGRVQSLPGGARDAIGEVRFERCAMSPETSSMGYRVAQVHHDVVSRAPPGMRVVARNDVVQAFEGPMLWATQFHPEATPDGQLILQRFCEWVRGGGGGGPPAPKTTRTAMGAEV